MQSWAYGVGLLIGSVALLAASYVWVKHQRFGSGGAFLTFAGLVLVGLSVWSRARLEVSDEGMVAEFEKLQQEVAELSTANARLSSSMDSLQGRIVAGERQFESLARKLTEQRVLSEADLGLLLETTRTGDP